VSDAQAQSLDALVGTKLGPYQIIELLGQGGMAVVFKARKGDDPPIALKVLSSDFTADTRALERFQREAQTTSQLDHPNIIKIYGIGEDRGYHFFAMEFLPHRSLHDIIEDEGKFEIEAASTLVEQTLDGLGAAHGAGVIHRDLKPENIMMGPAGEPILVDFGIAKTGKGARLTQTGVLLGTPYYMSPEQITGKEVTLQSDLYSMGVVLYELLTAEVPFQADSTFMITYKHCTEAPPPPRKMNPEISEALELVVLKALEKDLEKRYQSAEEFADDLRRVRDGESVDIEVTKKRDIYSLPDFRDGMDAYKRSEYEEARQRWRYVIDDVPDPEFAAEANRWIATSFFDQEDYLEAFRIYKHTADRWPDTEEYLDGCCFQQLQKGEKLLMQEGREAALDAFQELLDVLDDCDVSEAEKAESHWIRLTEERAYEVAEELKWRYRLKSLAVAIVIGSLLSVVGLMGYFRFVDPFAGHLFDARIAGIRGDVDGIISAYLKALELKPDNAPTMVRLSEALLARNKQEEARQWTHKVLSELEPENPKALALMAEILAAEGRNSEALSHLERSLKADPTPPHVWVQKGQVHEALAELRKAEDSYVQAIQRDSLFADAYVALAQVVWAGRRDSPRALQLLEAALKHDPGHREALFQKGRILAAGGDTEKAERALRAALGVDSRMVQAYYQLAILYSKAGQRGKARHELERALQYGTESGQAVDRIDYLLGQIYEATAQEKEGQEAAELRDKAEARYQAALAAAPERPRYAQRLGAFYFSRGAWEHAATAWKKWVAAQPGQAEPRFKLGQALLRAELGAEAAQVLADAERQAPERAEIAYHLGLALADAGDTAGAAQAFQRALARAPDYVPALMGATKLAIDQGDAATAARLARDLGSRASGDPAAATLAGRAAGLGRDLASARRFFLAALASDADHVPALAELGLLELSAGDREAGARYARRALELSPNQDRARELRDALARSGNGR
jgi:serine/threonine protein kinase/predicted Zn-dependent protease